MESGSHYSFRKEKCPVEKEGIYMYKETHDRCHQWQMVGTNVEQRQVWMRTQKICVEEMGTVVTSEWDLWHVMSTLMWHLSIEHVTDSVTCHTSYWVSHNTCCQRDLQHGSCETLTLSVSEFICLRNCCQSGLNNSSVSHKHSQSPCESVSETVVRDQQYHPVIH